MTYYVFSGTLNPTQSINQVYWSGGGFTSEAMFIPATSAVCMMNGGNIAGVGGHEAPAGDDHTRLDDETESLGGGKQAASDGTGDRSPGLHVSGIGSLGAGAGDESGPDEAGRHGTGPQDEG